MSLVVCGDGLILLMLLVDENENSLDRLCKILSAAHEKRTPQPLMTSSSKYIHSMTPLVDGDDNDNDDTLLQKTGTVSACGRL